MPTMTWVQDDYPKKIIEQIKAWSIPKEVEKKTFITISREFGTDSWAFSQALQKKMNEIRKFDPPWLSYSKRILDKVGEDHALEKMFIESLEKPVTSSIEEFFQNYFAGKPPRIAIFKKIGKTLRSLASNGHVILVGSGARFVTKDMNQGFHVRLVAPFNWRVKLVSERDNMSLIESEDLVKRVGEDRDAFVKEFFFSNVSDPYHYHLTINRAFYTVDEAVDLIIHSMTQKGLIKND